MATRLACVWGLPDPYIQSYWYTGTSYLCSIISLLGGRSKRCSMWLSRTDGPVYGQSHETSTYAESTASVRISYYGRAVYGTKDIFFRTWQNGSSGRRHATRTYIRIYQMHLPCSASSGARWYGTSSDTCLPASGNWSPTSTTNLARIRR